MALLVSTLVNEIRQDLDETTPAVWGDLVVWLNAGVLAISAALKTATREDWVTNRIVSDSGTSSTIFDETYDHDELSIVSGTSIYNLPPDCLEIRYWEPKDQSDQDSGIRLIHKDMSSIEFIQASRDNASTERRVYYYDTYGKNQVRIVPAVLDTFETEMMYVRVPPTQLTLNDTLDYIPDWTREALKAYVVYRAHKQINHPDVTSTFQLWKDARSDMLTLSAPRQSIDPVVAEGVFDEEDFYIGFDTTPQ